MTWTQNGGKWEPPFKGRLLLANGVEVTFEPGWMVAEMPRTYWIKLPQHPKDSFVEFDAMSAAAAAGISREELLQAVSVECGTHAVNEKG